MPLIKKPDAIRAKKQIRIRLDAELEKEINHYCEWADLPTDYFFDQVVKLALKKDKDWKQNKEKFLATKEENAITD